MARLLCCALLVAPVVSVSAQGGMRRVAVVRARGMARGTVMPAVGVRGDAPNTISGTVYEDRNYGGGAGRSLSGAGGTPIVGATVQLYGASGGLMASATTAADGTYSFTGLGDNSNYIVRVVLNTVRSGRTGSTASLLPVQTWRWEAPWNATAVAVTDEVGGQQPGVDDAAISPTLTWTQCATENGGSSNPCAFTGTRLVRYGNNSYWVTRVATGGITCSNAVWGDPTPGQAKSCEVLDQHFHSASSVTVGTTNVSGVDFGYSFDVVTHTNNAGAGSLRQAITNATTLGGDNLLSQAGRPSGLEHLVFMIPNGATATGTTTTGGSRALSGGLRSAYNFFSGGVATIAPTSALPTLSDGVVIDAQTQPGWTATPVLEINGTSGGTNGFELTGGTTTIRGFIINRYSTGAAIRVAGGSSHVVAGNWLGTTSTGLVASSNSSGIRIASVTGMTIGGTASADRNVIAGNSGEGVRQDGGSNVTFLGNYVGVGANGTTALGNGTYGIWLDGGTGARIGTAAAGARNVLAGQSNNVNLLLIASGATVEGNFIGLAADGTALPNTAVQLLVNGNSIVVGGTSSGSRNYIGGGAGGITVNGTGVTIQNNYIGADTLGTATRAISGSGILLNSGATGALIGGNVANAGNLIVGATTAGVNVQAAGAVVRGNVIGLTATNATGVANGIGILVSNVANTIIGDSVALGRNVIGGNTNEGIQITGASATNTRIWGNYIGTDTTGTVARANGTNGIRVQTSATGVTIGGSAATANRIRGNTGTGVAVLSTASTTRISQNAITANGGLGIDLSASTTATDGVTANAGTKPSGTGNSGMNQPVFTTATLSGTSLVVAGYVGSAANQSTFGSALVEVFVSDNDGTGFGEGVTFVDTVRTDASGNFSKTFTGVSGITAGTTRITGTATDGSGNTSEFGANAIVQGTLTISGTIFEDVNYGGGAGRPRSTATGWQPAANGSSRATVELYDGSGNFLATTQAAADGTYSFGGRVAGSYQVRLVTQTAPSSRAGWVNTLRPVLTFKTNASTGTAVSVTDSIGGTNPNLVDTTANSGTQTLAQLTSANALPQAVTPVTLSAGDVTGVDFGINFSTITSTRDAGQGSLRQFLINANALGGEASLAQAGQTAGVESSIFVLPTTATGYQAGTQHWRITALSALPALSSTLTVLDGLTQSGASTGNLWAGTPHTLKVELFGNGLGTDGVSVSGASSGVRGVVIGGFTGNAVLLSGGSGMFVRSSYLGLDVTGSTAAAGYGRGVFVTSGADPEIGGLGVGDGNVIAGSTSFGAVVTMGGVTGVAIRGNFIGTNATGSALVGSRQRGYNNGNGTVTFREIRNNIFAGSSVAIAIESDDVLQPRAGQSTWAFAGNYVGVGRDGTTALANGIGIGAFNATVTSPISDMILGGTQAADRNVIAGNTGIGIYLRSPGTGIVIQGNYVGVAADGTTARGNGGAGISIETSNAITIGGPAAGAPNVVANNGGAGISVVSGTGATTIRRNSVFGNTGIGIDLTNNGVTANDGAKTVGQPNELMDHPVFTTAAIAGSNLTVAGYVGSAAGQTTFANALVEVFVSDADGTGFGEGRTLVDTVYTDANGNFSKTFTGVSGITAGTTRITGTATDGSGNTSEFGANVIVQGTLTISGTIFEDVNYGGGAGRPRSTATGWAPASNGSSRATVELYDGSGNFVATTQAAADGTYSFTNRAAGSYQVRAVLQTTPSSRTGWVNTLRPVLTFRTDASSGTSAAAVTDRVGGEDPTLADTTVNSGTQTLAQLTSANARPQAVAPVTLSASDISGVDFGVHFTTVTNTLVGGSGTLSQALANANALGGDASLATAGRTAAIEHVIFMLPNGATANGDATTGGKLSLSGGLRSAFNAFTTAAGSTTVATILPTGTLTITAPVVVDAQTQPGWTTVPRIELRGDNAGSAHGIRLTTGGITLRGLIINRYPNGEGIWQSTIGNGIVIQGNWIGVDAAGTARAAIGAAAIWLGAGGNNHVIGGTNPEDRNVLSGSGNEGLAILSGTGHVIQGNYIGTDVTGAAAIGNGRGIRFYSGVTTTTIGGTTAAARNVISGNTTDGILIDGSGVTIAGNYIGLNTAGTFALANNIGVRLAGKPNTIGGTSTAARNVISGNTTDGIVVIAGTGTGTLIQNNWVGLNAAGTARIANGVRGVNVSATNVSIGTAGAGNVINGGTTSAISVQTGATGTSIRGNIVGLAADGTTALSNGFDGISIAAGSVQIGGTTAAERNVIGGFPQSGIALVSGANGFIIEGNYIGQTATLSAARPNTTNGISVDVGITGGRIGGAAAGAANVIAGNTGPGVSILGTSSAITVSRNSIYANGSIGIDLTRDGVTTNDGASTTGQPNRLLDHPVFTSVVLNGTTLQVAGYVGSAAGQTTFANALVELFISDNDGSGFGEGQTFIDTVYTNASGGFSKTFTGVNGLVIGTTRITGTATDGSGNTSEFGANAVVSAPVGSIAGRVFEDRNYGGGAGRNWNTASASGATGRGGVRVELFSGAGTFTAATTTAADGTYSFAGLAPDTYAVRVVSDSVTSARTGATTALKPVLTYRADAASGSATDVTDAVGGVNPLVADAGMASTGWTITPGTGAFSGSGSGTAHAVSIAALALNAGITNLDFGFSFSTVTNTNDAGQGSLRQALINANTLGDDNTLAMASRPAGIESIVFMVSNGTTGSGGSLNLTGGLRAALDYRTAGVAVIAPVAALPAITSPLVLNAHAQPGWTSAPVIVLDGVNAGTASGLTVNADNTVIRGFGITRFTTHGIHVTSGNNTTLEGNWIGLATNGTAAAPNGATGITFASASTGARIGGTGAAQRNIISGNTGSGLVISAGTGLLVQNNWIGTDASGNAALPNGADGIVVNGSADNVTIGGVAANAGNVIGGHSAVAVRISAGTHTIAGNRIGLGADGSTVLAGAVGVRLEVGGTLLGGSSAAARNVISGFTTAGVELAGAGNTAIGNYIGTDATGAAARANAIGIMVTGAGNSIGGVGANLANLISGNTTANVRLETTANASTVQGNIIGGNAAGTASFATVTGIDVRCATGCTIGGTITDAGNTITGTTGNAILVATGARGNTVRRNGITVSGAQGIDLDGDGVTANDGALDAARANSGIDAPVLQTALSASSTAVYVSGYVGSAPGQVTFANTSVDIYATDVNAAGRGAGRFYVGTLTTNGSAAFAGTLTIPAGVIITTGTTWLTATATETTLGTSEFGANLLVTGPVADVVATMRGPATGLTNAATPYTITVRNIGPLATTGTVPSVTLPSGVTVSNAGTAVLSGSTLTWPAIATIAVGDSVQFTFSSTATAPGTYTYRVASTSGTADPDGTNNDGTATTARVSTLLRGGADVTVVSRTVPPFTVGVPTTIARRVVNVGDTLTFSAVTLTDSLPAGVTYVGSTASAGWSCAQAAGVVQCTGPVMAPNDSAVVRHDVMLSAAAAPRALIPSRVAATGDVVAGNNLVVDTLAVSSTADVRVAMVVPVTAQPGSVVVDTITVTNLGPSPADSVVLTATASPRIAIGSVTGACSVLPCTLTNLALNEQRVAVVSWTLPVDYVTPDPMLFTARVAPRVTDPVATNDTVSATVSLDAGVVAGVVFEDRNGNATQDAAEPGLPAVRVHVVTVRGDTLRTTTGADGTWQANGVPSGVASVTVFDSTAGRAYVRTTPSGAATVTVARAATVTAPAVGLQYRTDIVAALSGPSSGASGQPLPTYRMVVSNRGLGDAATVVPRVVLTAPMTLVSASNSGSAVGDTISWPSVPTLVAGDSVVVTFVTQSNMPGSFALVASATTATADATPANNDGSLPAARVMTVLAGGVDIAVSRTLPASFVIGQPASIVRTVRNVGLSPTVAAVVLTDSLPAGVSFVSATGSSWTCAAVNRVVTCTLPALAPGDSSSVVITTSLSAVAWPRTALWAGSQTVADVNAANNIATDSIAISSGVDLVLRSAIDSALVVGRATTLRHVIRNAGTGASIAPMTLLDTLPAGLSYRSVTGAGWTCSASGGVLSCVRPDSLVPGDSTTVAVTLDVARAAIPSVTVNSRVTTIDEAVLTNNVSTVRARVAADFVLFAEVTAQKSVADLGDPVDFTGTIKVVGESPVPDVTAVITLPRGFGYQPGSLYISGASSAVRPRVLQQAPLVSLGGVMLLNEPELVPDGTMRVALGDLAAGASVSVRWRVRLGPGSQRSGGSTRLQAVSAVASSSSNVSTALVKVRGGVFSDRGIIFGKVFLDCACDEDGRATQETHEVGVPGVRLIMEDGTSVITDAEGKYSLPGLRPMLHVVRIDPASLPAGAELVITGNRNVGNAGSRFVDLTNGEFQKADFALARRDGVLQAVRARRMAALRSGGASEAVPVGFASRATGQGSAPLSVMPNMPDGPTVRAGVRESAYIGDSALISPKDGVSPTYGSRDSATVTNAGVLTWVPKRFVAAGLLQGRLELRRFGGSGAKLDDGFDVALRGLSRRSIDSTYRAGMRAAFYASGDIAHQTRLTLAFDSERDTELDLLRDIDPDNEYAVFGDASVREFDARSAGGLSRTAGRGFARLDRGRSTWLLGDFTAPQSDELRRLSGYDRTLTGLRNHVEVGRKTLGAALNGFVSRTTLAQRVEELPGEGVSGPYQLRRSDVRANSERVEIIVRDRNQPAVVLSRTTLGRFTDYTLERDAGRLLFRAPVPSVDAELNPVSVRVSYEVETGGDPYTTYGADGRVTAGALTVGAAAVRDENPLAPREILGVHGALSLGRGTALIGEVARSTGAATSSTTGTTVDADTTRRTGDAVRLEFRHQSRFVGLRLTGVVTSAAFANPSAMAPAGRTELGGNGSVTLTRHTRLLLQMLRTEDRLTGGRRDGALASIEQQFGQRIRLELGGRWAEENRSPVRTDSVATAPLLQPNSLAALRSKLSVDLLRGTRFRSSIAGEFEQDVRQRDQQRAAISGDLGMSRGARLYARHELLASASGPFGVGTASRQAATVIGLTADVRTNQQLFNEYRLRDGISGRQAEAAFGLRNRWRVDSGLVLNTSFERVAPVSDTASKNRTTAITGGFEFTRWAATRATARAEFRRATGGDSWLGSMALAQQVMRGVTFLGRAVYTTAPTQDRLRAQLGVALRPVDSDVWNALVRVDERRETASPVGQPSLLSAARVFSLHLNVQPDARLAIGTRYAFKRGAEDAAPVGGSGVLQTRTTTQLLSARALYDLTPVWDVAVQGSVLGEARFGTRQTGLGVTMGRRVMRDLRVAAGYNLFGWTDADLAGTAASARGFVIDFGFKFDETTLRRP